MSPSQVPNSVSEYWTESVAEALCDAEVQVTSAQLDAIASDIEHAHEMHGEATGQYIFSANLRSARDTELEDLKRQLHEEVEKVVCPVCRGEKTLTTPCGTSHVGVSQCWKCRGAGRIK